MIRGRNVVGAFGLTVLCAILSVAPVSAADGFVYAGGFYDDRYSDTSFALDAIQPFGPAVAHFNPYLNVAVNVDSQTLNASIPEILTDNYALGALGFQYTTAAGLRVYSQFGVTARIGAVDAHEPGGDFRGGAELSRSWKGSPKHPLFYGNYYGSAAYSSRNRDAVLLNELEEGRTFRYGSQAVDLYVRALVSFGSHRYYYTNLGEGAIGLRFHSPISERLTLSLEESAGVYLRGASRPLGQSDAYHDFRINAGYGLPF